MAVYASNLLRADGFETGRQDHNRRCLRILKPIWTTKPETASRLRGRIEKVLDAARAKGIRHGENPARWRGNLEHFLGKQQKLHRGHHAAMPWVAVPEFVRSLRGRDAMAARALEFAILTAVRTGEVLGAQWLEIDLSRKIWTIAPLRTKAGRPHRVPLVDRACAILEEVAQARSGEFIFPGRQPGHRLSSMSMDMLLRRMAVDDCTVHGFRTSFKVWATEATTFANEISEAALGHVVGDRAKQAYRRTDVLERRRELMEAWAAFLEQHQLSRSA
jgi:integrase